MLSSAGASNPVRQIARVVTTAWNEWRGISSDGVTVAYSAEAAPMTDGSRCSRSRRSPAGAGRRSSRSRGNSAQDWATLQTELVRLIADGRDVNDAIVFFSGTASSNQPNGIMNGVTASASASRRSAPRH